MDSEVIAADPDWALVRSGRLLVNVWRSHVTLSRVQTVDAAIAGFAPRLRPDGYGAVTVLEPSVSMLLPEDARSASNALQRRWGNDMRCSAYLVEGRGFLPAAVRTMTSGMALITRSPAPIRVFSTLSEIADWVAPQVAQSPAEVQRVILHARSAGLR